MLSRIVRECLTDSYKSDTTSVFWLCHMNKCILIIKMHSPFGMNMENLCLHRFPCHSTSFSNWKSKNGKGVKFCHKLIYNLQKFSWNGGRKNFLFFTILLQNFSTTFPLSLANTKIESDYMTLLYNEKLENSSLDCIVYFTENAWKSREHSNAIQGRKL